MKSNYKLITLVIGLVVLIGVLSFTAQLLAEQPDEIQALEEMKKIDGEVISLTPLNDPKYIGITYILSDADYYFMIADDVQVIHKSSIKDIKRGDVVEITFKETTKQNKRGEDMIDRMATKIKYIRPAKKEDDLISK